MLFRKQLPFQTLMFHDLCPDYKQYNLEAHEKMNDDPNQDPARLSTDKEDVVPRCKSFA